MTDEQETPTAHARFFRATADFVGRSETGRRMLVALSNVTALQRVTLGGPNPIHPWEDDAAFRAIVSHVRELTLLTDRGLFNLYQAAKQVASLRGDVVEVGVYKGGTGWLLGSAFAGDERSVLLFDTFEGMPESADPQRDRHHAGDFSDTSLPAVSNALADWPKVSLVPGFFPDTAGPYKDSRFALVHVDVDIYRSVLDCCEFFYPRLETGGAMVFDDYGLRSCPGAKQAVDEFFATTPERPFYLPTGQCLVWKVS